jgi:geranylgeranyl diphosphate synthase type II
MDCYDETLNTLLDDHINTFFNQDNLFKGPVRYSLSGGKRVRAKIALDICDRVSKGKCKGGTSALGIEYIHASSLIIDDLPCMDNAFCRRSKECVHIKFGEAIAQLTSVVLLSMAMHSVSLDLNQRYKNNELTLEQSHQIGMFFMDNFSHTMGHNGAAGGQLMDLSTVQNLGEFLKDTSKNVSVETIIQKKTGTFFETAFLLGWLIGGGSFDKVDQVTRLANDFAMVFQITDDIEDINEDLQADSKNVSQNYAIRYGLTKAIEDSKTYLARFEQSLDELDLNTLFFQELIKMMKVRIPDMPV